MSVYRKSIILFILISLFILSGCSAVKKDNAVEEAARLYFGEDFNLEDEFAYREPTTGMAILSSRTYVFTNGKETHCIIAHEYYEDSDSCLFDLYFNCQVQQNKKGYYEIVSYSDTEVAYYINGRHEQID